MGIDRQRIVDNFYPAGSEVATYFTPVRHPVRLRGRRLVRVRRRRRQGAAGRRPGFPNGFNTKIYYRDVVRGYLPDPNVVAQDLQAQLKDNLGINATIDVQESATFLDNAIAGKLTASTCSAGAPTIPDPTNFLDYHFGNPGTAAVRQDSTIDHRGR